MNKQVEQIRAEIVRRIANKDSNEYANPILRAELRGLLAFIDSLPDEQTVSNCNGLKEAAEESWTMYEYTDSGNLYSSCYKDGFLAGAKWQREQMMKDAIDGEVVKIFPEGAASIHYQAPCGIGEMAYFCKAETLKDGDKVKVIIIKEDEQ